MTPSVLVVTNAAHEPPGLIVPWLAESGVAATEVRPWRGDALPDRASLGLDHAGLVVMGGPQSAYDDPLTGLPDAPWLTDLKGLLAAAVAAAVPVLAVCLGAQLLAEACGGMVRPGEPGAELGARLVARRDLATSDPLFARLPMAPDVVQWHWDEITLLPPGAVLLASSPAYPHQAFRLGPSAYGLQFHIEVGVEVVAAWAEFDAEHLAADPATPESSGVDVERLLRGVAEAESAVRTTWRPFVAGWADLVRERPGGPR